MISLNELVGEKIIFRPKQRFQPSDSDGPYIVTLQGVEAGGVWIEHPALTAIVAASVGKKANDLVTGIVFFFPYSEIHSIAYSLTRLDPEALGL
jgi:hypothetical protein